MYAYVTGKHWNEIHPNVELFSLKNISPQLQI
jgi:hypothetical protein